MKSYSQNLVKFTSVWILSQVDLFSKRRAVTYNILKMDWIYFVKIQIQIMRIFTIWFFYTFVLVSFEKLRKHMKGTKFEIPVKIVGISISIYHSQTIYQHLSWHTVSGIADYYYYYYEGNLSYSLAFMFWFQYTFSDFDLSIFDFLIHRLHFIWDLYSLGILGLYHWYMQKDCLDCDLQTILVSNNEP